MVIPHTSRNDNSEDGTDVEAGDDQYQRGKIDGQRELLANLVSRGLVPRESVKELLKDNKAPSSSSKPRTKPLQNSPFKKSAMRISHVEIPFSPPSLKRKTSRELSSRSPGKKLRKESDESADDDDASRIHKSKPLSPKVVEKAEASSSRLTDRRKSRRMDEDDDQRSYFPSTTATGDESGTDREEEEDIEAGGEEKEQVPSSRTLEAVVLPSLSPNKRQNYAPLLSQKALGKLKEQPRQSASSSATPASIPKPNRPDSSQLSTPSTTLLRRYYGEDEDEEYASSDTPYSDEESTVPKTPRNKDAPAKNGMISTLTPIVDRIVGGFFNVNFRVERFNSSQRPTPRRNKKSKRYQVHEKNPHRIVFGNELETEDGKVYYESVTLDGEKYKVGDIVMVQPGDDARKGRQKNFQSDAAQSVNEFIRIWYFYENIEEETKMFHGQWFEHGSKTLLQQTSHSRALYLTNTCGDAPLNSIYRKCDVHFPELGSPDPEDDDESEHDQFFCQYLWEDDKDLSFLDLPSEAQIKADLAFAPAHRACHSCVLEDKAEVRKEVQYSKEDQCVSQYGINYHVDDFVYLRPSRKDQSDPSGIDVLEKAQIVKIHPPRSSGKPKIVVKRMNSSHGSPNADERLLKFEGSTETISFDDVNGKFYAARYARTSENLERWIKEDDHFYVDKSTPLSFCSQCLNVHKKWLEKLKNIGPPLRGLELFSGAGGLGSGLDASGYVKTVAAVEWDKNAAETYQRNHPKTSVFCEDVNELLHAILNDEDVQSLPRKGRTTSFPEPGDIDLISGGPPCQAFSKANHHPKENDERATLPFTMLSYTERYRQDYFLLENVVGILNYRLRGVLAGRHTITGGIKHGVFKLIVRTLLALGYQVHVKVLQAANYGAPQGRQRVIFLGAKQGLKIPDFPIPTHAFRGNNHKILENDDLKLHKPTRSPDDARSFAPFRTVLCRDAIEDLAPFDWKNPHQLIRATGKDLAESRIRLKTFPCFPAVTGSDLPGFKQCEYAHPPMNTYQRWLREKAEDEVTEHVTATYRSNIIECSTNVPLRARASHLDIPAELHRKKKKNPQPIFYGRLDANDCFKTAMTRCAPNIKASYFLHYSQKRVVTVREYARAQGFPDSYTFMRKYTAYKQIGNAVPVPLALALGKSLGDALVVEREREARRQVLEGPLEESVDDEGSGEEEGEGGGEKREMSVEV
ncbi:hypothetical protein D9757_006543 [Collybiopsis confluens]|uniref:Cytosine-specific methyltransferase n=1 Tax=Collybiopsis confluens TaxID=2823264 RepID=A0A8H5HQS2_9AGAR|nr:hypothetical protein D9757_006543 [Collybiopsis confluens]